MGRLNHTEVYSAVLENYRGKVIEIRVQWDSEKNRFAARNDYFNRRLFWFRDKRDLEAMGYKVIGGFEVQNGRKAKV